jgi:hypothetical protein
MTIPGCFPGDAAGNAGAVDQSVMVLFYSFSFLSAGNISNNDMPHEANI